MDPRYAPGPAPPPQQQQQGGTFDLDDLNFDPSAIIGENPEPADLNVRELFIKQ